MDCETFLTDVRELSEFVWTLPNRNAGMIVCEVPRPVSSDYSVEIWYPLNSSSFLPSSYLIGESVRFSLGPISSSSSSDP
jgi:hypothetical protein